MTCSQCEDMFAAHFEGLLDEAAERQLGAHLAECEACRMSLDETRQLVHRLAHEQQVVFVPSITPVVMDRIVHEQSKRLRRYDMIKLVARISVAAAVLACLGIGLLHPMSKPIGGRIYAAELSAARKQMEDAKTATWKISYYQRFDGPVGAGSRWFRSARFDQRYAYKAPGLYRCEQIGEDGKVGYVSIEDQASRAKLDINHETKTATLTHLAESLYHPRGPFGTYMEPMEREDLRPLGNEDFAGRSANGFRAELRNGPLGEYRSLDFWLDAATKRLIHCQQPGRDLFPADLVVRDRAWDFNLGETLEYQGKVFRAASGSGAGIQGHIVREIAFDVELDDSQFSLVPPAGYALKAVEPPLIAEKDVLEFMGVVVNYFDRTFPERMPYFNRSSKEEFERYARAEQAVRRKTGASPAETKLVEAMDRWHQTGIPGPGPMHVFITQQIAEGSWKYLGNGVKLGDKDRMIGWYRPKGSRTYRVVYGDLSVKDIEPADLPLPVKR
jgi:hypothetical protein